LSSVTQIAQSKHWSAQCYCSVVSATREGNKLCVSAFILLQDSAFHKNITKEKSGFSATENIFHSM